MAPDAITFRASLDGFPGVDRDVAVRSNQTLVALHRVLQQAFGWDDDHLYSFWLDGEFWGSSDRMSFLGIRVQVPAPRTARRARSGRSSSGTARSSACSASRAAVFRS